MNVRGLRLEAIFHPKFDNEKSSQQTIRKAMKQKAGEGYLEVSVKHSGSLLLWSGGDRFYSKNSTDNLYSLVGELLLRQHFIRANHDGVTAYQDCSDYLEAHRMTLSFEVVTSFMGDHGDRPNRDFLILTAVADRKTAQFFSTADAIEFAQRFRLPHNDCWVFQSAKAIQGLFDIYDETRETGTASTVLPVLNQAADTYVPSMYPHDVFQGDILEGLVIRFVPSTDTDRIRKLAQVAQDLLTHHVPVTQLDGCELVPGSVNLRQLWKQAGAQDFEKRLREEMGKSTTPVPMVSCDHSIISEWMSALRGSNDSTETAKIATLLSKLVNLTHHVQLKIRNGRILIVHVIHDETFKAFERQRQPGELHLFRGFSIELLQHETDPNNMDVEMGETSDEPLMLKMKFLPYMVRTFGCRNGLTTIRQGGPTAFMAYVQNLLTKWQISQASRDRWIPFFRAWGSYAAMCFDGTPIEPAKSLPELESSNYLEHLVLLSKLFEKGEFRVEEESGSDYKGLVIVVSPMKEEAQKLVDYVSQQLGGLKSIPDLTNPYLMDDVLAYGRICSQHISDRVKALKPLVKKHPNKIALILFECDEGDIAKRLLPSTESKKLNGMMKVWKSLPVVKVESFDASALSEETQDGDSLMNGTTTLEVSEKLRRYISTLKDLFHAKDKDARPGALVFFTGIPGCGKSTCVSGIESKLKETLTDRSSLTVEGDKIKQKYWNVVRSKRIEDTATITIADKNSPPQIWPTVAEIAAATKAIAIPVVPDQRALQTTTIQGVRFPNGETDATVVHHYPFSLQYLAVCMSRVLQRKAGTHVGRLDNSTPRASMIVVNFYGLYRNIKAEELGGMLSHRILSANATMSPTPIRLPFFGPNAVGDLPEEIVNVLIEAIQCQVRRSCLTFHVLTFCSAATIRKKLLLRKVQTAMSTILKAGFVIVWRSIAL